MFYMFWEKFLKHFSMFFSSFKTHLKFQTQWLKSISTQYSRFIRTYFSSESSASYQNAGDKEITTAWSPIITTLTVQLKEDKSLKIILLLGKKWSCLSSPIHIALNKRDDFQCSPSCCTKYVNPNPPPLSWYWYKSFRTNILVPDDNLHKVTKAPACNISGNQLVPDIVQSYWAHTLGVWSKLPQGHD